MNHFHECGGRKKSICWPFFVAVGAIDIDKPAPSAIRLAAVRGSTGQHVGQQVGSSKIKCCWIISAKFTGAGRWHEQEPGRGLPRNTTNERLLLESRLLCCSIAHLVYRYKIGGFHRHAKLECGSFQQQKKHQHEVSNDFRSRPHGGDRVRNDNMRVREI